MSKLYFIPGSQDLYGDECLEHVAAHAKEMVEGLNASGVLPFEVVWKPTLLTADMIRKTFNEANNDESCAGVITWMHTFSPAKNWIRGTKLLQKPLRAAGKRIGVNEVSAIGPLLTLVNSIPMLETMKDMDERGKVLNAAFCVTGAFMFGDFFGYVGAVNASMLLPMIIAKLSSGIVAIAVSLWMSKSR